MKKHTALYERISVKGQSETYGLSIAHQKELLESFANKNGFTPFRHYTDIGISGTHFNRPGFQEMLEEIRKGTVDAVIVADVSRFGRNYLESAHYTEELFPRHGVRFLSVLDDVDTFRDWEMEFLPFLHLIHDWYARESSRKSRQVMALRQNAGLRGCNSVPFGYMPDPQDWNRLIPDPAAAPVVRQIFRWALEGRTPGEIARELQKQHAPTPRDMQLRRKDPTHTDTGQWRPRTVQVLLRREVYTGMKILRAYHVPVPGSHRSRPLPKEEQIRVPDSYVPLISKEDYDRVQELLPPRKSSYHYDDTTLQPWQDLLWHGIRSVPLRPCYNQGIVYWGDTSSAPTPQVRIRQEILLEILSNLLVLLLRDGLSPEGIPALQQRLQGILEASEEKRTRLAGKAEARRRFYNHELKQLYEKNLRRHAPMPAVPERSPLPSIEEQDELLQTQIRRIRDALDGLSAYTPETPLPAEELLPDYLSRVVLFPREKQSVRDQLMHLHVTPAFAVPSFPPPGEIFTALPGDAPGNYAVTIRYTHYRIHLHHNEDAPDLLSFLQEEICHSDHHLFPKEASP